MDLLLRSVLLTKGSESLDLAALELETRSEESWGTGKYYLFSEFSCEFSSLEYLV